MLNIFSQNKLNVYRNLRHASYLTKQKRSPTPPLPTNDKINIRTYHAKKILKRNSVYQYTNPQIEKKYKINFHFFLKKMIFKKTSKRKKTRDSPSCRQLRVVDHRGHYEPGLAQWAHARSAQDSPLRLRAEKSTCWSAVVGCSLSREVGVWAMRGRRTPSGGGFGFFGG